MKHLKTCIVCGKSFTTDRIQVNTCSPECHRERANQMSRDSYHRRVDAGYVRKRTPYRPRHAHGLTAEQMLEVDRAQDCGNIKVLRECSSRWTPAQHKYARKRYEVINGLFHYTYNP